MSASRRVLLSALMASAIMMIATAMGTAERPTDQAWDILQSTATNEHVPKRVSAMQVLQLLPGNARAVAMAEQGLVDKKPEVRAAAAVALGLMKSKAAVPIILAHINGEKDGDVVLAEAKALVELGEDKGYEVYYAVVSHTWKNGQGLVAQQEKELNEVLQNPKKMAYMAFQQGIGYVPFGGVGFTAYQAIRSVETGPNIVEATAIKVLGPDPDPRSGQLLVKTATTSKSTLVRAAAYDALARRGEKSLRDGILPGLEDEKEQVRLIAAAAVIRLSK